MATTKEPEPQQPGPMAYVADALEAIERFMKERDTGQTKMTGPELLDHVSKLLRKAQGVKVGTTPAAASTTAPAPGAQTGNPPTGGQPAQEKK